MRGERANTMRWYARSMSGSLRWRMSEVERAGAGKGDGENSVLRRLLWTAKEETVKCKMGVRASWASDVGDKGVLGLDTAALGRMRRRVAILASTRCACSTTIGHQRTGDSVR